MTEQRLTRVYGRETCVDTRLARRVIDERGVDYEWHDVAETPQKQQEAMDANGGSPRVPTIVFPNGSVLVEPDEAQLLAALAQMAQADEPGVVT
jgi:mycoredoxin